MLHITLIAEPQAFVVKNNVFKLTLVIHHCSSCSAFFSGQSLSRAAYARLYSAGFPPILDRNGDAPEVLDPTLPVSVNLARESADPLQCNEIIFQFLAFSQSVAKLGALFSYGAAWLSCLHLLSREAGDGVGGEGDWGWVGVDSVVL